MIRRVLGDATAGGGGSEEEELRRKLAKARGQAERRAPTGTTTGVPHASTIAITSKLHPKAVNDPAAI